MSMVVDGSSGLSFPDTSVQPKSAYGPAFSAYGSALQSLATSSFTKVAFNTLEANFPNVGYDNTTNYRFTPQVAGLYQINASVLFSATVATSYGTIAIYKNGSSFKSGQQISNNAAGGLIVNISNLVYLNGSTDYVEIWMLQNSGGNLNSGSNGSTYAFQGILVRAA